MSIVNLLPEDYGDRRAARRTNAIALVLFAVVMASILAGVSVNQRGVNVTQAVLAHVTADYEDATKLISKLKELDQRKQNMQEKTKITSSLVERQPRSFILGTVTNAMPDTACITSYKLQIKKQAAEKPAPGTRVARNAPKAEDKFATELEISGLATTDLDVTAFMTNLQASPLVKSADMAHSKDKKVDIKDIRTNKKVGERVFRDFKVRVVLHDTDVMDIIAEQKKSEFSLAMGM